MSDDEIKALAVRTSGRVWHGHAVLIPQEILTIARAVERATIERAAAVCEDEGARYLSAELRALAELLARRIRAFAKLSTQ